jgi:beta-lactamase regulating signal transducer with metallopeptidase domain
MNELFLLLDDGSTLWAQTLWHASVSGALAIVLLWASRYAWPQMSPVMRCWLWRALFGKLLLGLFWSASVSLPVLPAPAQDTPIEYAAKIELDLPPESPNAVQSTVQFTERENSAISPNSLTPSSIALLLWLAGIAFLVGRGLNAWRTTRQWREAGELLHDSQLNAVLEDVRSRFALPRVPEFRACPTVNSPALIGVRYPVILLPQGFLEDYESQPRSVEFMLAHELAHHRRRDLSWNWLLWLGQTLFWFHPLVWLAAREWRLAQEVACDELAIQVTGAPVAQYGTMLLQTAVTGPYAGNLFAASISERYSNLRWRLVAMKHFSPKKPTWRSGAICLLLSAFILVPWALTPRPPVPESPHMQRLKKLQQAAALSASGGKGAVVELCNRPGPRYSSSFSMRVELVRDYDLPALVKYLRAADAEGLAVNGVLAGNSTAVRCEGSTIFVGKQPIAAPFRIEGIGDARCVHKFLSNLSSFYDQIKKGKPLSSKVVLTRAA